MKNTVIDQMGRSVLVPERPLRIVSLVPSQTELIVDLIGEDRLVGLTKFCIHPTGLKNRIQRVGGTKNINIETLRQLNPDLIIGNKEENEQKNIEEIAALFPIWMSDIVTLEDALKMIQQVGVLINASEKAEELVQEIQAEMLQLDTLKSKINRNKVLYFIWHKPDMIAGHETFIHAWFERLGLINACSESRYPMLDSLQNVQTPDFVFLSSEPYPFKDKHIQYFSEKFPKATIKLVDGECFSWYGSTMKKAPRYFMRLFED